jgi:REP element-mobilizing transposase RayT
MNRGRRAEIIFTNTDDYQQFVELLKETVELWNLRISAYCLMPNHYHLLVQTPEANISRCMRHINGVYTQRYNSLHHCEGQLFRGRFKSILVDADNYLLQLMRYIHKNPLRSGLTDKLDDYAWSSHQGYLSLSKKWDWLHKEFVLSCFAKNKRDRLKHYRRFMSNKDTEQIRKVFEKKKWPAFLGSDHFVNILKEKFFLKKLDDEVPQVIELAPEMSRIIKLVCQHYQLREDDMLRSKRGCFNEPRNVAIYLTRRLRNDTLKQIGEQFGIKKYSSVSSVIERTKSLISEDRKLKKKVKNLLLQLSKSQEQT